MDAAAPEAWAWLTCDGEMAALTRMHDWAATPLGRVDGWPQSLKVAVSIMLTTRHPVSLYWGPEHIFLYNDALVPSLGPERHPSTLGRPASEVWQESWPLIEPELRQVMAGGDATWQEDRLVPIRRHGRIEDVYWTYSLGPVHNADAPNGVGGALAIATETTAAVLSRHSDERYRALFESIDEGFCIVELLFDDIGEAIDYVFLEVNPAFESQTGLTNAVGKSMRTLRRDHEAHWFETYGRVALTGKPERFELEAAALGRWYNVYAFRVGDPDQRHVAILFNDITQHKLGRERAQLLTAEIDHRARNLLAVIGSIVQRTQAGTTEVFAAALNGRIQALARAHTLLSDSRWQSADLNRLVREELAPFGPARKRATISGPVVALKPTAAQMIGLVLHELATNAAKYGALSVPEGRVTVRWSVDAASAQLTVRWHEQNGPPVVPPCHRGFGNSVIEGGIEHQLGGVVHMEWRPKGLVCKLTLPAKQIDDSPLWP